MKQLAELGVTDFMHEARDGMNPEFIAYAKAKRLVVRADARPGKSRWYLLRASRISGDGSEVGRVSTRAAARC